VGPDDEARAKQFGKKLKQIVHLGLLEVHGKATSGVPDNQILRYRIGAIPPYCYA
jgi:hypothetical protein